MLTESQISIIKATAPVVAEHALEITGTFYPLMFDRYPEVAVFFNQSHQNNGAQRQALGNAIIAYALNIDNLQALSPAVKLITHKHCSLGIAPEHYDIVGECLMAAIGKVLGDAVTPEIADAWDAAYRQLANMLISVEKDLYNDNASRSGNWKGEKEFTVATKEQESEEITSFYLKPTTGDAPIDFLPGQYICLILNINGDIVRRNYSLSGKPGEATLRISVKREMGGAVSNYLHDEVNVGDSLQVTAPCGDFILDQKSERPLVLLTGGVGITPAISMLDSIVDKGREIIFIHAARHAGVHAFHDHVEQLAERNHNLTYRVVYSEPRAEDKADAYGFISDELLGNWVPENRDVDLYFLGPKPFMQAANMSVKQIGIPAEQVRYEFFGPLESLA